MEYEGEIWLYDNYDSEWHFYYFCRFNGENLALTTFSLIESHNFGTTFKERMKV